MTLDNRYVSGISDNVQEAMVSLLNDRLTEIIDLTLAVKQAHWTIKGRGFIGVHELLDDVADRLRESSDLVAERAVVLGGRAAGTTQAVADGSGMKPYPTDLSDVGAQIEALVDRFSSVGGRIREAIDTSGEAGDEGTADLFAEVSRQIDKDSWFIGANVSPSEG